MIEMAIRFTYPEHYYKPEKKKEGVIGCEGLMDLFILKMNRRDFPMLNHVVLISEDQ